MKRNYVFGLLLIVCLAVGCERLETMKVAYQTGQYPKDFEK
jgi:hypothetical protein